MTYLRCHCHTKLGVFGTGCRPVLVFVFLILIIIVVRRGLFVQHLEPLFL
jgi:branched-subunit amino acid ABC-type transport system permease component